MSKLYLFIILYFALSNTSLAIDYNHNNIVQIDANDSLAKTKTGTFKKNKRFFSKLFSKNKKVKRKSKLVASILAIALGPFGVHRLYLGTKPKVPLAYTLTLGGGFFVLPLIDLFYILFSETPEDIENNNHVFIWNKKKKK